MIPVFIFSLQADTTTGRQPREWTVPCKGGLIGRAAECDWVLEDPGRIVSRQHAKVMPAGNACTWTDLGTNPTLLNGEPMPVRQPIILTSGDLLKIGDCLIVFQVSQQSVMGGPHAVPAPPADAYRMDMFNPPDLPCSIDDLLISPDVCLQAPTDSHSFSAAEPVPVLARRMKVDFEVPTPPYLVPGHDCNHAQLAGEHADMVKIRSLLLASLQGYMRLLKARRLFRQETGSRLTVMSGHANNPLKILGSAEEALRVMLDDSPGPGVYLSATEAIEQAAEDVLVHMQASIAQIQSLIHQVQAQLNPAEIEQEAQQSSGFSIALPVARKARMWDLYCQHYSELDKKWS